MVWVTCVSSQHFTHSTILSFVSFMTDNHTLVEEELQVLEAIYPDYILEANSETVRLEVPVELGIPRRVSLMVQDESAETVEF